MAFEEFGQLSKRRREERAEKFRKKILIAVFGSFLLLVCIAGGVFAVLHFSNNEKQSSSSKNDGSGSKSDSAKTSSKIVKMLCAPTDYKDKCEETLTKVVDGNASSPSIAPKIIIKSAITAAATEVVKAANKTAVFNFDKPEEKAAYDVCKKLFQDSIDELAEAVSHTGQEVKDFHAKVADLKTWLSAVYSYQETCIDAFPEGSDVKTKIRAAVNATQEYLGNSLALVAVISGFLQKFDGGSSQPPPAARHLLAKAPLSTSTEGKDGAPEWLDSHHRRLLAVKTTANLVANLTVAKDGSGNYTSITDCLNALPENRTERIYIYVKEGIYKEYVTITKKMVNITMYGDGSQKTMITGDKNVIDGVRTFATATFVVEGEGFIGIALGFRNTAGPQKHQAVALRVQADRSIFLNCRMEGYQDTLYAQAHRQYYRSCYITGTVDFIFGDAAAVFQNCLIVVRKPMENQQNAITAQGRADRHENTGFVLQNCKIQPDKDLEADKLKIKTYLGRPWKAYSKTIVMESTIGDLVQPEGWSPWQGDLNLKTLYYAEFNNHGPGADVSKRVKWAGYKKTISRQEAQSYTVTPFLQAGSWIKNANVLVHYGLFN